MEGDDESWDFGTGAGFYVDATEAKWKTHYRMYSYIVKELPAIIYQSLPIVSQPPPKKLPVFIFSNTASSSNLFRMKLESRSLAIPWVDMVL